MAPLEGIEQVNDSLLVIFTLFAVFVAFIVWEVYKD